jgi:hypothetical protein
MEYVASIASGTWWTSWCRVDGLSTTTEGSIITIPQSDFHNTTLYANDTITPTMIKVLNSLTNQDTTQSKGWYASIGCLNADGLTHGLWLQEQLGWATLEQTMTYENDGDG